MLQQLRPIWEDLTPQQRIMLGIAAATTVVGLAVVAYWSSRPDYSVLYSGLSQEDASAVIEQLRAESVPYRLAGNGTTVLVPKSTLYETRLDLAGKGIPSGSGPGFELFDRSGLPGTDFSNRVNLQRALQAELARTISSLQQVQAARVHLSIPEETLYSEPVPPSASVVLALSPNAQLNRKQVRAIGYLVASAVRELDFDHVTIIDSGGKMLHAGGHDQFQLPSTSTEVTRAYNIALTQHLQTMLDQMFGPNMTIVRARATLDLQTQEVNEQRVEPPGEKQQGAVHREMTTTETYNGYGATSAGAAGVPSALGGSTSQNSAAEPGNYTSSEEITEYKFSSITTRKQSPPGTVTGLSVAAVVDESLPTTTVTRVRDVLAAAAGIDETRGDNIVVERMKLEGAEDTKQTGKQLQLLQVSHRRYDLIELLVKQIPPAVIAIVLLIVAVRTVNHLRQTDAAPEESADRPKEPQQPQTETEPQPHQPPAERQLPDEQDQQTQQPEPQPTDDQQETSEEEQQAAQRLRELAREKPDEVAQHLRDLVGGDG